jgi:hypothetical protein
MGVQDVLPQWDLSWDFGSLRGEQISITDLQGGLLLAQQPGKSTVNIISIPHSSPITAGGGSLTIGMQGHVSTAMQSADRNPTLMVENVTLDGQQCAIVQARTTDLTA